MKKVGLCSATFRNMSAEEIIKLAKDNNLNFIEWAGDSHIKPFEFDKADKIRKICEENNIEYSYGSYYKYRPDDYDIYKTLDFASHFQVRDVRIWAMRVSSNDIDSKTYEKFIKKTKTIADYARKLNINLHFEHHRQTLTDTTQSAKNLLEDIDKDNVFMYWQPQAFESIEKRISGIKKLKDRITNVHVFNWDNQFNRYPLAQAQNEWSKYIKELGGDRAYLLEFTKDDSLDQFEEDAKVLKQLIGG